MHINFSSLRLAGNWFVETVNIFLEITLVILYSVVVAYICILIGKVLHMSNWVNNIVFGSFVNKWKS